MGILVDKSRLRSERLQRFVVPELRYSQLHYEEALKISLDGVRSWLDVGCGHQILPPWRLEIERQMVESVANVIGVDPDFEAIRQHSTIRNRFVAGIDKLPFPDQTFDLVTANMVVEHLEQPRVQFSEISRVLKSGGTFLFHTPNLRGYPAILSRLIPPKVRRHLAAFLEGRAGEDVYPTYYRANTRDDITAAAEAAGLVIDSLRYHCSTPALGVIPALAAVELVYLRRLLRKSGSEGRRPTIICHLRKPRSD